MAWLRVFMWTTIAVGLVSTAAWLGYSWAQRPLWTGEESGVHFYTGFTSDGGILVSFLKSGDNQPESCGYWAIRHKALSGEVIGRALVKVDPSQLDASGPYLLNDNLVWLLVWTVHERRGPCSLFDLHTGERVAGPIEVNDVSVDAVDPNGGWFADMPHERDRVRIVAFCDGSTMFEALRPNHLVQEALPVRGGECVMLRWVSEEDDSETIELWEVASKRRLVEAKLAPRRYFHRGDVIADRLFVIANANRFSLSLSASDFGAERAEPIWDRDNTVPGVRNSPNYLVVSRNIAAPKPWQLTINRWIMSLGLNEVFSSHRGVFAIAVVDTRSGETLGEFPQDSNNYILSCDGNLLAATDSRGRVVVRSVRRSPERWAYACGLMTAIGVLSLACWRNRRCRHVASLTKTP